MAKFAADENFNNRILRGVMRLEPALNVVRVQDTEATDTGDEAILEWAAKEGEFY